MSLLPFLERRKDKSKRGRKAEKKAAARLGGKVVPGSGAVPGLKGDITSEHILYESKSTVKASINFRRAWLEKIKREAREVNKYPAVVMQFTELGGEVVTGGSWVAVPEYLFLELLKESK